MDSTIGVVLNAPRLLAWHKPATTSLNPNSEVAFLQWGKNTTDFTDFTDFTDLPDYWNISCQAIYASLRFTDFWFGFFHYFNP
jgi:hypothetical protein